MSDTLTSLKPILGGGFFYSWALRGTREVSQFISFDVDGVILLGFYSPTDDFIGSVSNNHDRSTLINLEIKVNKIGDLKSFNYALSRRVDIPFYNLMKCKIHLNGILWYTGEVIIEENQDHTNEALEYEGLGYFNYLDKSSKINQTYTSSDVNTIAKDLINTHLSSDTPIKYNPAIINLPSTAISSIEFNKKSIKKCFDMLLDIANKDFRTTQYRIGVNNSLEFFAEAISTDLQKTFFEGYQYQEPEVSTKDKDIINKIDIFKTATKSNETDFVDTVQDTTSQALYGVRAGELTIADFVDDTTAQNIANARLELLKQPITTQEVSSLIVEQIPFNFGFYNLFNKQQNYTEIVSEFEDIADWTTSLTYATVTNSSDKVLTGKRAFKVVLTSDEPPSSGGYILQEDGASKITLEDDTGFIIQEGGGEPIFNDYIEYHLDEALFLPNEFILYMAQNTTGVKVKIEIYDEDLNPEELSSGIDVVLLSDYVKYTFTTITLNNIKRVRIYFSNSEVTTLYLDRMEITQDNYKTRTLVLDTIKYQTVNGSILAEATFSDKPDNFIVTMKKITERQRNLYEIFEKDKS